MIEINGKSIAESAETSMGKRYNPNAYAELLVEHLPGVIRSEKENEKAIELAGRLMRKGERGRSPEEERLLALLVTLIEDFEEKAYPIGSSNPAIAVRELMREHGLKQTDMIEIFGSQGTVSQVLNGKREIRKSQAKKLSARFHLPVDILSRKL
jgi:HTH-type transcriptional regulator/antitoxin HigA